MGTASTTAEKLPLTISASDMTAAMTASAVSVSAAQRGGRTPRMLMRLIPRAIALIRYQAMTAMAIGIRMFRPEIRR